MPRGAPRIRSIGLNLRVLGYQEDGEWVAHCLEMDVVGHGRSFRTAMNDLRELILMQVTFAMTQNMPSLLDHPAPPDLFMIYERVKRESLSSFTDPARGRDFPIASIPLPEPAEAARFQFARG